MIQVPAVSGSGVTLDGSGGHAKKVAKAKGQKPKAKTSNPHSARKMSRLTEDVKGRGDTLTGDSADAVVDSKTGPARVRAEENKQGRYSSKSIPTGATLSREARNKGGAVCASGVSSTDADRLALETDEVSRGSEEEVREEDADSIATYSSNEESAATPFQHRFAELLNDVAGTRNYRATIIGALVELNAHHEATTNTNAVVSAMRDHASVRAAFPGIHDTAVIRAIRRVMSV